MFEKSVKLAAHKGIIAQNALYPDARHVKDVMVLNSTNDYIILNPNDTLGVLSEACGAVMFPNMNQHIAGHAHQDHAHKKGRGQDPRTPEVNARKALRNASCDAEKELITRLIIKNVDVFATSSTDVGKTELIAHEIDTGMYRPYKQAPRQFAPEEQAGMEQCVLDMQKMGLIRPSRSPWASNVRMVKKKSGEWRLCVDYRDVNKRTINDDPYLLPRVDATLNALAGARYFCSLDLLWGYFQVPLSEDAIPKCAFYTPRMSPSHWEFVRMPFGLKGAPATFQRMVDRVLAGIEYHTALAYLDDIIVYGRTFTECADRLQTVFDRVRSAGLKLKPAKCELFQDSLNFLGHLVTSDGIKADPDKIVRVKNFRLPMTVTDVKSFLGLVGYCRKFIKNMADRSKHLNDLTKRGSNRIWTKEHTREYNDLKEALCTEPVLALPIDDAQYVLDTDASAFAIGAVLSQLQPNKDGVLEERVIAYDSRILLPREQRYCVTKREFLAVYEFVRKFYPYIGGTKFIIRTDHKSLLGLRDLKSVPDQFARWLDYLNRFDYEMQARAGKEHANADAMSRLLPGMRCFCDDREHYNKTSSAREALEAEGQIAPREIYEAAEERMLHPLAHKKKEFIQYRRHAYKRECVSQQTVQLMAHGRVVPHTPQRPVDLAVKTRGRQYVRPAGLEETADDLAPAAPATTPAGDLDAKFVSFVKKHVLINDIMNDADLSLLYDLKLQHAKKPSWSDVSELGEPAKHYLSEYDVIYLHNELLYREWESRDGTYTLHQLIVPKKYSREICRLMHDSKAMCHQGLRRTKEQIRARFYWFRMNHDIARYIDVCEKCQLRKRPARTIRAPLQISLAGFPNERVNMDICGPVIASHSGNKYVLVITDSFTKYTVAAAIADQRARTIASTFMEKWALIFGFPYQCHSDQGSCFTSVLWTRVCEELAIEKTQTTAYHPEGNSQCERFNSTLMQMLYSILTNYKDWDTRLSYVTFAYNSTQHKATGYSPYFLMYGRRPLLEIDVGLPRPAIVESHEPDKYVDYVIANISCAYDVTRHHLKRQAEVTKRAFDRKSQKERFAIGDIVLLKKGSREPQTGKFEPRYVGKYFVVSVFANSTYRVVRDDRSPPYVVHHNRLRRLRVETPEEHKPAWLADVIARFALRRANTVFTQTGLFGAEAPQRPEECKKCGYTHSDLWWRYVQSGECDVCRHLHSETVELAPSGRFLELPPRKTVVVRRVDEPEARIVLL